MTTLGTASIERLDRSQILALGVEWETLRRESSSSSPFTTWAWVGAWLETLGQDADLEVHVARDPDSGQLIGVAPLFVADTPVRGVQLRSLHLIGSGPTAPDHLDFIVHRDAPTGLAHALWDSVTRQRRWDLIDLDGVTPAGHLATAVLRRANDQAETIAAPYLPLAGGWDTVAARFSGRVRSNLKRYGAKLERDASVTEWLVSTPSDFEETFDHLIRLHQHIRTQNGDPGVFAQPEVERFLRAAARRLLSAGRLRLWRLDADNSTIAVMMCIRGGDAVAFYTTGYDTAWAKYGPGRRIMARAIHGAIDEGATKFDFLRGDEPYKREWGTESGEVMRIVRPTSAKGRLVDTLRGATRAYRRLRRRA